MKKIFFSLFVVAFLICFLAACTAEPLEGSACTTGDSGTSFPITEQSTTSPITTEQSKEPFIQLSENIREYDLDLPENSAYLKYKYDYISKNRMSKTEAELQKHPISGGRTILEDYENTGNLYLIESDGSMKLLLEGYRNPDDLYQKSGVTVCFWNMVSENKFAYHISQYEAQNSFGVYDLETGKDHRITGKSGHYNGWYARAVVNNEVLFVHEDASAYSTDFVCGIGKINLDTFTFSEIDLAPLRNELGGITEIAFLPDGIRAVLLTEFKDSDWINAPDYRIYTYSLTEQKILQTYILKPESKHVPQYIYHCTNEQVFIFSDGYEKDQGRLYMIDLQS